MLNPPRDHDSLDCGAVLTDEQARGNMIHRLLLTIRIFLDTEVYLGPSTLYWA
jgi:hypothetical protein